MKEREGGRCFVRSSGTEEVIRIYPEAKRQEEADELAQRAKELMREK